MKLVIFSISLFLLSCSSYKSMSKNDASKINTTQSLEKKPSTESKNSISNSIKTLKKDEIKPGRTEEIKTEKKEQDLENNNSNTRSE